MDATTMVQKKKPISRVRLLTFTAVSTFLATVAEVVVGIAASG